MLLTPYPHMYITSLHEAVVMSTNVCCLVQQIVKAHCFDAPFQGHTCQLLISSHCIAHCTSHLMLTQHLYVSLTGFRLWFVAVGNASNWMFCNHDMGSRSHLLCGLCPRSASPQWQFSRGGCRAGSPRLSRLHWLLLVCAAHDKNAQNAQPGCHWHQEDELAGSGECEYLAPASCVYGLRRASSLCMAACFDISQHLTLELMRQQACVTSDHGRMTKVNLPGIARSLPMLECCFCIQLPFVGCTHGRAVVRSASSVHSFLLCAHHDRVAEFCSHRYASQASPVIPAMQQSMCRTSNTVHGTYRCHLCRISYVLEPRMCPAQSRLQV